MAFPEAVRFLARRGGVALPERDEPGAVRRRGETERLREALSTAADLFRRQLLGPAGEPARRYLSGRGLSRETIKTFSIGYALPGWEQAGTALRKKGFTPAELQKAGITVPRKSGGEIDRFRNRVIFPIADPQGRVVGFGGRLLDSGEPKYLNSPETPLYHKGKVLYGLSQARSGIRTEGFGVLVEGYVDLLTPWQEGIRNVVATSGTALTEGHLSLMRRFSDRWTVVFDGDAAGIRAAKRSLELFVAAGVFARAVLLPHGSDPDTFIRKEGADAFRECLAGAQDLVEFFLHQVRREHDISTVEGKVAAVRETVPLLARVRDQVARTEYAGRAAQLLGVKEEVLWTETQSAAARQGGGRARPVPAPAPETPLRTEEAHLVRAMITYRILAEELRSEVSPEDFENDRCRRVVEALYHHLDRSVDPQVGAGMHFEDEGITRMVSSWLADAGPLADEEEARQVARDCIGRIRRRRRREKSRDLQRKIEAAEKAGERETLTKLLAQKHGLRTMA